MAIKLLALDLDDTLLDKSNLISPRCREAIRQAVDKGVVVTLATGRMYESAVPYARQLGLDIPIITYTGALIKSGLSDEVIFTSSFEPETAAEVLELFRERDWYIQVYMGDKLYVKEYNEKSRTYEALTGIKAIPAGLELYAMVNDVYKMMAVDDPAAMKEVAKVVHSAFQGRIFAPLSRPMYLEMVRHGVNKGVAIDFLAKRLGIRQSEVMAVGDSNNDVDMLKYAGLGVAMGNAMPEVKAIADAVTLTNDEDGVAEAIQRYILAE